MKILLFLTRLNQQYMENVVVRCYSEDVGFVDSPQKSRSVSLFHISSIF